MFTLSFTASLHAEHLPEKSPNGVYLFSNELVELRAGQRRRIRLGVSCSLPEGMAGVLLSTPALAQNKIDIVSGELSDSYRLEFS